MVRFPDSKRPRNMTDEERLTHRRKLGREASARYYAKNRAELNAKKTAKYASSDKTRIQQYGKDYYQANKDRLKKRALDRYYKNKGGNDEESDKKMSADIKE